MSTSATGRSAGRRLLVGFAAVLPIVAGSLAAARPAEADPVVGLLQLPMPPGPPGFPPPPPPGFPPPPPPAVVEVEPAPPPPPPPPPNPFLHWGGSVRVTYGVPAGAAFSGQPLDHLASGLWQIAWQSDLVILQRIVVGPHVGIGIAPLGQQFSNGCTADRASCTILNFEIGGHAEFRFFPGDAWLNPWVGAGVTWEDLILIESNDVNSASGSFNGVDVDLSVGADLQRGYLGFGPFFSYRFGKYTNTAASVNGEDVGTGEIIRTAFHDWFMFGVRGRY